VGRGCTIRGGGVSSNRIGYCTVDCGRGAASPLAAEVLLLPLPNATTADANPAKIVISRLAPAGHRE
jgi:hypothetical protein